MTRSRRAGLSREEIRQQPLYARVLGLQYLAPGGFLCFVFLEGAVALGILLALAELVSWWGVVVLPISVAAMVKLNDVVAGALTHQQLRVTPAGGAAGGPVPAVAPPASTRVGHNTGPVAGRGIITARGATVGRRRAGTVPAGGVRSAAGAGVAAGAEPAAGAGPVVGAAAGAATEPVVQAEGAAAANDAGGVAGAVVPDDAPGWAGAVGPVAGAAPVAPNEAVTGGEAVTEGVAVTGGDAVTGGEAVTRVDVVTWVEAGTRGADAASVSGAGGPIGDEGASAGNRYVQDTEILLSGSERASEPGAGRLGGGDDEVLGGFAAEQAGRPGNDAGSQFGSRGGQLGFAESAGVVAGGQDREDGVAGRERVRQPERQGTLYGRSVAPELSGESLLGNDGTPARRWADQVDDQQRARQSASRRYE